MSRVGFGRREGMVRSGTSSWFLLLALALPSGTPPAARAQAAEAPRSTPPRAAAASPAVPEMPVEIWQPEKVLAPKTKPRPEAASPPPEQLTPPLVRRAERPSQPGSPIPSVPPAAGVAIDPVTGVPLGVQGRPGVPRGIDPRLLRAGPGGPPGQMMPGQRRPPFLPGQNLPPIPQAPPGAQRGVPAPVPISPPPGGGAIPPPGQPQPGEPGSPTSTAAAGTNPWFLLLPLLVLGGGAGVFLLDRRRRAPRQPVGEVPPRINLAERLRRGLDRSEGEDR